MSDEISLVPKAKKPWTIGIVITLVLVLIIGWGVTGFFVVQPIGSLPEGITIWYVRAGSNMPFISSPDGLSLKATGSVSLMSRGIALGQFSENFKEKIIARLGYSEWMYSVSTNGASFDQ